MRGACTPLDLRLIPRSGSVEGEAMSVGGRASLERAGHSERRCLVTRQNLPKDALIRFVLGPDSQVVPDLRRRLPGRGAWVTAHKGVVAQAVKKNAFARAFRHSVTCSPQLAEEVEALLRRSALEALSLANKAGEVVTGFTKLSQAVETGRLLCLLHAQEAAPDGCRKLDRKFLAMKRAKDKEETPKNIWRIFSVQEMSLALGRGNVIHAGLIEGGATRKFLQEVHRWMTYRDGGDPMRD